MTKKIVPLMALLAALSAPAAAQDAQGRHRRRREGHGLRKPELHSRSTDRAPISTSDSRTTPTAHGPGTT